MFSNIHSEAIPIAVLVFVLLGGFAFYVIRTFVKRKYELDHFDDNEVLEEPETAAIGARVISKRIDIKNFGSYRAPSHNRLFLVTFLKDDGSTVEFDVSEDTFNKCTPYMIGTLVTVNGEFFDFGDGEEIN